MSVFSNFVDSKNNIFCDLTKIFFFIITAQSGQWAARCFSVILHMYFSQFKHKELTDFSHLLQQRFFIM